MERIQRVMRAFPWNINSRESLFELMHILADNFPDQNARTVLVEQLKHDAIECAEYVKTHRGNATQTQEMLKPKNE
jgi:hypothetical protein